ncbi:MAG: hypothetical protein O2854_02510 [Chloroflexi bacterium]|nr:hypothetical protein [Chloroflexota bacterium]
MGFFGNLLGRSNKPRKGRFLKAVDALESLKIKSDFRTTGKIGIVFNPSDEMFFKNLGRELMRILHDHPATSGVRFELIDDAYTSRWIALEDRDFVRLANAALLVGNTFIEREFRKRLLAIAVPIEYERQKAYWIYSYKRDKFHPFIPTGEKSRDGKAEMKLGDVMKGEGVSVEGTLELWYPLWGIPF